MPLQLAELDDMQIKGLLIPTTHTGEQDAVWRL